MTSAEVLLHPVRLRIAQAFLGGRRLTTGELARELPDVPAASLYRQVARLLDGGVLAVAAERRVRGAVERTYELRSTAAAIDAEETGRMSREDHRSAFLTFVSALLAGFDRYLEREEFDPVGDELGYSLVGLWLSDEELSGLSDEIARAVSARLENPPSADRRRRLVGILSLPADPPEAA